MTSPKRKSGADAQRNRLYGKIHQGAKALFGDVSEGGIGRDDYQDFLKVQTGRNSCRDMSFDQLKGVVAALTKAGAFDGKARGGKGKDRPTTQQWAKLGAMARDRGWSGLEDARFQKFVERTAKVKSSRMITRKQASDVILGLQKLGVSDEVS